MTGARGRLGSALVDALRARGGEVIAWSRPDYDLDDPSSAHRLVSRDRPSLVIHCAAWTDVDGCARSPEVALRRNAHAARDLAAACAAVDAALVLVSTNEVFDGRRADGRGYTEHDRAAPMNPYGLSKLAAETAVVETLATAGRRPWIVRTSWLFGPPGQDFPAKIVAAADALGPGEALRVVHDEFGTPTFSADLAAGLLKLVAAAPPDVYHLAAAGAASRLDFAQLVVDACRPGTAIEPMAHSDYSRASKPPAWGVLDTSHAASFGVTLRDWRAALAEYLESLC